MNVFRALGWACFLLVAGWASAQDLLDSSFAPVIRGPGFVRALAWHPASARVYASVNGDKLNGQSLTTSLIRFDAEGNLDVGYAPAINGTVSHMVVMADGRIVLAGSFTVIDGHATTRLARLLSDGSVDRSFVTSGAPAPFTVTAMAVGSDGWIYLGAYTVAQTAGSRLLTRVSPSGVVSSVIGPRFGITPSAGSSAPPPGSNVGIRALHVTASGDVLVGGVFTEVEGSPRGSLAKVGPAGELRTDYLADVRKVQTSVGPQSTSLEGSPGVASILSAGGDAVYVGGFFDTVNGQPQRAVARLDSSGNSDPAFRIQFDPTYFFPYEPYVERMAQDALGRLILVGTLEGIAPSAIAGFAKSVRVNSSGEYDSTFSSLIWSSDHVVVLPGNDVVFGRAGALASGGRVQPSLGKISSAGVTSNTFKPDLRKRNHPDWLLPRPGQGPLLGGTWILEAGGSDTSGGLASLTLSGAPDSTFANNAAPNAPIQVAIHLPDGRLLLGGSFTQVGGAAINRLALVESDGRPVAAFDLGTGPDSDVTMLRLLPSGRVLVGGSFARAAGEISQNVFVLDPRKVGAPSDMRVQEIISARYGTSTANRDVKDIVEASLSDGHVLLDVTSSTMGGDPAPGETKTLQVEFRTDRGVARTARIREGGSLRLPNPPWDSGLIDATFAPAHTEYLWIKDAAEQSDGRILLLGSFSTFAGQSFRQLVRLERNGALDTTFNPQAQFSSFSPITLRVDGHDRIYIAGFGMRVSTSTSSRPIHRLTSTGAVDPSFNCASFITRVEKLVVTPDDSVWCIGEFLGTEPNGRRRVARLTASGALDTRFAAGESANAWIKGIHLEPPGRLWLTGWFTTFQGAARDGVALINLASPIAPLARVVPRSLAVKEGTAARFGLADIGAGESYVWRKDGVVLDGATGTSLELAGVEPHHAGLYEAEIQNGVGYTRSEGSLTVEEATLGQWLILRGLAPDIGNLDTDGDGVINEGEYHARTDPANARSVFRMGMEPLAGGLKLRWPTYPGRRYVVEESSDLIHWTPISPAIKATQLEHTFEVPLVQGNEPLFWRVLVSK